MKATNELNQSTEYAYDLAGNLVSVTDGNRNVTTYTYDRLSRLTREENAEGAIAEYTYDYLGNVSTYTVYGGNNERATTIYTYDAAGNLTKETSPLGYETSYTYDAKGNVTSRTDENGTVTSYTYDALGRLTKRSDSDGQVTYTYDKVGNITSAANEAGTVSFTYDELYRTTKVTNEDGTDTEYTYDAAGNRLSITYPDGEAVTTNYDVLGQITSLTDHDGTGILYTRDAEGRVTKETYSDGSTTEYTYNAAGLLTLQKEVANDNSTRRQIVYAYDDAGNLTSENRSGVGIEHADELVRYYYDRANQLVKVNIEGVTTTYTYDKAGNLLSDGEYTYTYDLQNRLITKTGADGVTTYTYDKVGNLISDGTTTYTYNAQNKLIKGETASGESSEYVYNALGVRITNIQIRENRNAGNQNAALTDGSHGVDYLDFLKDGRADWQRVWETEIGTTVQNETETVTRHYVVDYLSIANRDIYVIEDGSYTTRYVYDASGTRISAEFDYAPGTHRGEAGENLQSDIAVSIGKVFYRTSILGSTLFAVDRNSDLIAHAIYDPWGNPLTKTYTDSNYSGLENLNNFTGYTWDETLKLYFAQNRFYDARTHRFTQEDRAKGGWDWYIYCENNPVLYIDCYGLLSYIIYREDLWPSKTEAEEYALVEAIRNAIKINYGESEIVEELTGRKLTSAWNSMNDSETINCVVILTHASATTLNGFTLSELKDKSVDLLVLAACNAGHLSYSNNVASAFGAMSGVNKVIASDGTVYPYSGYNSKGSKDNTSSRWDNGEWTNQATSKEADVRGNYGYFIDENNCLQCITTDRSENEGWILYQFGLRVKLPIGFVPTIQKLISQGVNLNLSYNTITMQIGNSMMYVNGACYELDTAPIIIHGRTLVPIRAVSEALGASVSWDATSRAVTINRGGTVVGLTIGSKVATVNGRPINLDVAPIIQNDRTMVPLRFISEAFGANVEWDGDTKSIHIGYYSVGG